MIVTATPYGRPAAALLRQRIAAAKAGDPLQPVTVIVPANSVGVSTRRLLANGTLGSITARGSGIAGLMLLTVYRLAELLGAPPLAALGRRPVSTPIVAAAIRSILATAPGIFEPVREHPSTTEALVRAHRELSELQPAALDAVAATGLRGREVVRLHRAVRRLLEPRWYEEVDLMAAADETLRRGCPVTDDLGTVILYLPQELSLPAAALVRTLSAHAAVEVIAGYTGAPGADADVDRSLRRLGLQPPGPPHGVPPPDATAVVSVSDAEEEVRSAVQRLVEAARDGVALERMAVLYPTTEPYARIVAEQLSAAGIAFNGRAVRPLTDRVAGRWLLDLLALPDRRYARPAVLGLVSAGPLTDERRGRPASGTWERISREAGIVDGVGEWTSKLARYAQDARRRAHHEAAADEPRDWRVERLRRNAEQADGLRAFVTRLCADVERARTLTRWPELVRWAREMLERHLGAEHERAHWPEAERVAAERVEQALDRLAGLDEVEQRSDLRTFARALELELDGDLGRVGEFGQGVLVGPTSAALGVDLDVVVILGLAEGVCPAPAREDSLLPDADRAAAGGELRLRAEHGPVEHRHLLAALAASSMQRILTFPRGDLRRTVERAPSRWLLDAVAVLRGDGERELPASAPWLELVPSFASRTRSVAFPPTRQLYGLRALAQPRASRLSEHPLVVGDPALRLGVQLILARADAAFTRFDGNLAHLSTDIPSPTAGAAISATRLETWLACPHSYFVQHLLRVEPVENPEELLEISALEKGSLIHGVLERWLGEQLAGQLPAPGRPWPGKARRRMRELAEEACRDAEERGTTGHRLLWQRDRHRIVVDLERFVDHDDERRLALAVTPLRAEHPFGLDGRPPLAVDLGDGRVIRVLGRIDRVDRCADGRLVVVDYKTGGVYGRVDQEQPLGDGTKLQLALYALAVLAEQPDAGAVRSEYWFVSTKGQFKRLGCVVDEAVVATLRRALRVAVDGIEGGRFPLRPPAPAWSLFTQCRYCDPDELGTSDRYRDWERLRHSPELRDYLAYIDPPAVEEVAS